MSDDTAKLIDSEVRRVVNRAYEKTKKMIKKHMPKLKKMVNELMEHVVLLENDILMCFGPRPARSLAAAAAYDPASRRDKVRMNPNSQESTEPNE